MTHRFSGGGTRICGIVLSPTSEEVGRPPGRSIVSPNNMGAIADRARIITAYFAERYGHGRPPIVGPLDREVLVLVDGVGGFQAAGLIARRALREAGCEIGTILFRWQTPIYADIFSDLMWLRRNRVMGARLSRLLLTFRREHPSTRVHLMAYSGGTGIAVFALERLAGRSLVDTLILACPALSPTYNLGPALRSVRRAYALVSPRDSFILGFGTRTFGTIDRVFTSGAGRVGFRKPPGLSEEDDEAYGRLREFQWTTEYKTLSHHGTHAGWVSVPFLREHLPPLLDGAPRLPMREIV